MKKSVFLFSILLLTSVTSLTPVNFSEVCHNYSTPIAAGVGAAVLVGSVPIINRLGNNIGTAEYNRTSRLYDSKTRNLRNQQWNGMDSGIAAGQKASKFLGLAVGISGATALTCGVLTKIALKYYAKPS